MMGYTWLMMDINGIAWWICKPSCAILRHLMYGLSLYLFHIPQDGAENDDDDDDDDDEYEET